MRKHFITMALAFVAVSLSAQEWVVPVGGGSAMEMVAVDGGEHILYVGSASGGDGFVVKVDKEGDYITRRVHLPGMALQYYSALQLPDGNYMAFGICDDSLADYRYQRYMHVDVFNTQLESVSSETYDMDDEVTDLFNNPLLMCRPMKPIVTRKGTVLLAATPAYRDPNYDFPIYNAIVRFFEFDEKGVLLRIVDNPTATARASGINTITYAPNSDNLMVFVAGGVFGNASYVSGIMVVDTSYTIVAKQSLFYLGGQSDVSDSGCDGHWIDGQYLIVDAERYIGDSFTYHTLYKVDSALHVYGQHVLEPSDSCSWVPTCRNTAYVNDSTIFAFSSITQAFTTSPLYRQANIALFDKDLNLLGRKVIKADDVRYIPRVPAVFNDGGCLVQIREWSGQQYPGDPFNQYKLMKFRREDIEITWDVVEEQEATQKQAHPSAYPNPTKGTVNIPIDGSLSESTRLQIFDMNGAKCFDCAITGQGNLITLDVSRLGTGMYVYQVVSGGNVAITGKFIKE